MAWTTPRTWVTGEVVTAAEANAQWRDNMNALQPTGKLEYFLQNATAVETLISGAWLEANGVDVSRTTYATLWGLLGTTLAAAYSGTTTLNGAIATTGATAVTLAAWPGTFPAAGWPSDGRKIIIQVDSEKMLVTAGFGTTSITVVRGVEGTAAATHLNGATVSAPAQSPFGHGDGSTTFSLPDAAGRGLVAAASGGNADVTSLGASENTVKANRRQRHRHTVTSGTQLFRTTGGVVGSTAGTTGQQVNVTVGADPTNDPLDAPSHIVLGVWAVKI